MKIAKRVLVVAMVVAMVAGLCVMAFASDPTIALVPTVDDGEVAVAVVLKDAIGAMSWDINVSYDKDVLAFSYAEDGADVAEVGKTKGNTITTDYNGDTEGLVKTSGYFKTSLTDYQTFVDDSKKAKDPANVNVDACEVIVLYFEILDDSAYTTDLEVVVTANGGVEFVGGTYTATLKEAPATEPSQTEPANTEPSQTDPVGTEPAGTEPAGTEPAGTEPLVTEPKETEPKETEPVVTEPKETEPAIVTEPIETEPAIVTEPKETEPKPVVTEPTTSDDSGKTPAKTETKPNPDNGGSGKDGKNPDTGDNMALYAAGAVVMLAGAAFIISKKRK